MCEQCQPLLEQCRHLVARVSALEQELAQEQFGRALTRKRVRRWLFVAGAMLVLWIAIEAAIVLFISHGHLGEVPSWTPPNIEGLR